MTDSAKSLKFVLLGAGGRGRMFAEWLATNVAQGAIVAVAEPDSSRRARIAELHHVPEERCYDSWESLLEEPRLADIAINTTMDRHHIGSAVAAMEKGYHMLLEKPMAVTPEDCTTIEMTQRTTSRYVSVCHSLRYHDVYVEVRRILREGLIGDIVSVDQLEAVELIHQSHSFVRGNWGNSARSTFMLMAKSCHDIDILADLVQADCERVASFGSTQYFRSSQAPTGAPKYCVEGCPVSETCAFYAPAVYGKERGWRYHAGLADLSPTELHEALKTSPYGRCVFHCDNDAVDHQIVAMEFSGGITVTFTMTAFTPFMGRVLRIHGTGGYLEAHTETRQIRLWRFGRENSEESIQVPEREGGHGGADPLLIETLMEAVAQNDPSLIRTTVQESLRTHRMVFAAEQARTSGEVVRLAVPNCLA